MHYSLGVGFVDEDKHDCFEKKLMFLIGKAHVPIAAPKPQGTSNVSLPLNLTILNLCIRFYMELRFVELKRILKNILMVHTTWQAS